MKTINDILCAHGYREGTEEERLLLVFKDLSHVRGVKAAYEMTLTPAQKAMADQFLKEFVGA